MPTSKHRKKPATPKRRPNLTRRRYVEAVADKARAAIDAMLSKWTDTETEFTHQAMIDLQGYFICFDRLCKITGKPYDNTCANQVLNRIHYDMPVSRAEIERLRTEVGVLFELCVTVRDIRIWQQASRDVEIYCHVHGWQWAGMGQAQAA